MTQKCGAWHPGYRIGMDDYSERCDFEQGHGPIIIVERFEDGVDDVGTWEHASRFDGQMAGAWNGTWAPPAYLQEQLMRRGWTPPQS